MLVKAAAAPVPPSMLHTHTHCHTHTPALGGAAGWRLPEGSGRRESERAEVVPPFSRLAHPPLCHATPMPCHRALTTPAAFCHGWAQTSAVPSSPPTLDLTRPQKKVSINERHKPACNSGFPFRLPSLALIHVFLRLLEAFQL